MLTNARSLALAPEGLQAGPAEGGLVGGARRVFNPQPTTSRFTPDSRTREVAFFFFISGNRRCILIDNSSIFVLRRNEDTRGHAWNEMTKI